MIQEAVITSMSQTVPHLYIKECLNMGIKLYNNLLEKIKRFYTLSN